ncbi:MAG: hypothetical protein JSS60_05490 [Verrucomicrobia bacterium]|nr:hypothetical protein [Verrucomicrobiota bacterium]
MSLKCGAYACGLFVLTMTSVSAESASNEEPRKPKGVTTQPTRVITPPQAPKVPHGVNGFVTADFIYWRTTVDNYQYAASGVAIVGDDGVTPVPPHKRGETPSPGFDFQPGFKVGAGLKFAHDGWDLYANYTWLNPETFKDSLSSSSGDIVGPADPYYGSPTLSKVKDRFQQTFNVLDLELGRQFFLSKYLTLRPYFGLKSAWINQTQKNFLTVFNNDTNGLGVNSFSVPNGETITNLIQKQKLESWGIGIRAGIAPVWYFIKNFGLYGNLAVSGMWTTFQNHSKTSFKGTITDPTTGAVSSVSGVTANIGRSFHTVTPVIELGLGLTYMAFFHQDAYALTVSAGWEEQMWIGFNGGFPGGSMSQQGFTFKAGFEF